MEQKIALVTGAARGLGLEFCRQLGKKGYKIVLTSRKVEPGQAAVKELQDAGCEAWHHILDVRSEEHMSKLSRNLQDNFGKLDILVNNAGINAKSVGSPADFLTSTKLESLDQKVLMELFQVNSLAPVFMTKYMLPLLRASEQARVLNISSWLGSISIKNNGGNYGYASSKAALNMLNRALAFDLLEHDILSIVINPGWVQTSMGGPRAPLTAEQSVKGMLEVVENLTKEDAGKFFQWDGSEHAW